MPVPYVRVGLAIAATCLAAACDRAEQAAQEQLAPPAPAPADGVIRGQLSFPSDYIPEDIQVCAREVDSGDVACNSQREGSGYSLRVPPGTYEVWAQTRDWPGVRAFFSEFVRCGSTVECTDHTPITVVVDPGAETIGVDPGDWYMDLQ